jgi:purine-nucleoside phosphorylase
MLRMLGADAVGMSTVPEVIACNHMSLPCCCISVITDICDPDNLKPLSVEEIIAIARKSESKLSDIYKELIRTL